VELFIRHWGEGMQWQTTDYQGPHEANFLKLDCSKLKSVFAWQPKWDLDKAVREVVVWSKCWRDGGDIAGCMDSQIRDFLQM
jgi:CDP-glucose 4,6-dehydratase